MGGQGEQIHIPRFHVHGDMAHGLHRVGVKEHLVGPGDAAQLGDRLYSADLVVGGHDGDKNGVRPDRPLQGGGIHQPPPVHRQVGDLIALLLQILGGVEDGVVLDGGGDDVAALPPLQGHELGHPPQGPVIRLRTAGGEVDLLRPGVEAGGDLRPRPLQVGLALLGKAVQAGGVAVGRGEVGEHGLEGGIGDSRGGRMVRINEVRHRDAPFKTS